MFDLESLRNEDLKSSWLLERLNAALLDIWRNSLDGRSTSTADLEDIRTTCHAATAAVQRTFQSMITQTEERRDNLVRYQGVKFISLGDDCMPRTLLTNWGIKPPSKMGEKSHPFDLMVSNMAAVVELIRTGFRDLLDPQYLVFKPDANLCVNSKFGIWFNHEPGPQYAENDFTLLRDAYTSRIERFLSDLNAPDIVFLFRNTDPHARQKPDFGPLIDVLHKWRAGKRTRYVCLQIRPFHARTDAQDGSDSFGVHFIEASYPLQDYVWWQNQSQLSPEGFAFELDLINRIKAFLDSPDVQAIRPSELAVSA